MGASAHIVRRREAPIPAQLPPPRLLTIPAAWLRLREPPTPAPITPCFPAISGGQRSRRRASTTRRPLLRVPRCDDDTHGRNLLVVTPDDWRVACSVRRPCNKPCLPGWAEIEQEWILWCTRMRVPTNLTLSRPALLSPSALCIGSFVGLATPVKFDIGGKQKSRGSIYKAS